MITREGKVEDIQVSSGQLSVQSTLYFAKGSSLDKSEGIEYLEKI